MASCKDEVFVPDSSAIAGSPCSAKGRILELGRNAYLVQLRVRCVVPNHERV